MAVKSSSFKVREPTYYKLDYLDIASSEPLPTENFLVFRNSRDYQSDQAMLNTHE